MNTIIERNAKEESIEIVNTSSAQDLSINVELPNKLVRSLSKIFRPLDFNVFIIGL